MLRVLARLFLNGSLHLGQSLAKLQYTNFLVDAKQTFISNGMLYKIMMSLTWRYYISSMELSQKSSTIYTFLDLDLMTLEQLQFAL